MSDGVLTVEHTLTQTIDESGAWIFAMTFLVGVTGIDRSIRFGSRVPVKTEFYVVGEKGILHLISFLLRSALELSQQSKRVLYH